MSKKLTSPSQDGPRKVTPEWATKENKYGEPWIEASPMFVHTFHPARYTVIKGQVVPLLGQQVLVDGVNLVQIRKGGRVNFAKCRAKIEEDGWQMVPFEWGPDGESYVQAIDTRPGGKGDIQTAHISVFSSAYAGDAKVYADEDGYATWLVGLMDAGKIPQPRPHKVRQMLEVARTRLGQARAKKMEVRAEALQVEVDALDAWLRKAGKPKAGKASGRKATTALTAD